MCKSFSSLLGRVWTTETTTYYCFVSYIFACKKAVVTGPAWTPMFACASAVVLQVGGVLQHGALCAREYAKPAVSSIDIHALLKDGMMVSVDGNTGIVKILDQPN